MHVCAGTRVQFFLKGALPLEKQVYEHRPSDSFAGSHTAPQRAVGEHQAVTLPRGSERAGGAIEAVLVTGLPRAEVSGNRVGEKGGGFCVRLIRVCAGPRSPRELSLKGPAGGRWGVGLGTSFNFSFSLLFSLASSVEDIFSHWF